MTGEHAPPPEPSEAPAPPPAPPEDEPPVKDPPSLFTHPLCKNTWRNGQKIGEEPAANQYGGSTAPPPGKVKPDSLKRRAEVR